MEQIVNYVTPFSVINVKMTLYFPIVPLMSVPEVNGKTVKHVKIVLPIVPYVVMELVAIHVTTLPLKILQVIAKIVYNHVLCVIL